MQERLTGFVFKTTAEKEENGSLGKKVTQEIHRSLVEETRVCRSFFMDAAKASNLMEPIPNLAWNSLPFESWVRNVSVTGFAACFHNL